MAEATLLSSSSRRPPAAKPFRSTAALLAGIVLLVALGAGYALMTSRASSHAGGASRSTPALPGGPQEPVTAVRRPVVRCTSWRRSTSMSVS